MKKDSGIWSLESGIGNLESGISNGNLESGISNRESRIGNLESGISNRESRIGNLESGISNRESRIGNLESGISNRESLECRIGNLESGISNRESRIGNPESVIRNEIPQMRRAQGTYRGRLEAFSGLRRNKWPLLAVRPSGSRTEHLLQKTEPASPIWAWLVPTLTSRLRWVTAIGPAQERLLRPVPGRPVCGVRGGARGRSNRGWSDGAPVGTTSGRDEPNAAMAGQSPSPPSSPSSP